jgi:hypothetical protein
VSLVLPCPEPLSRSKRSYDTLGPTQKRERRKQARAAVNEVLDHIGCPLTAIQPTPTPSPADLIHLPTSVREQIRSVPSLHIPCEQTMIKCKQELASSHATETGTFANGAYLTDPVRFVSVLCAQSPFIAVGGDAGGGHTKLGVTYSIDQKQHFAALLVKQGSDKYDDLNQLTAPGLTPFQYDSAAFPHIFAVLQHLINTNNAFLNGDWLFINAVLGLMRPSSRHPCPICIVSHKNYLHAARYRTPADKHSHSGNPTLLTIPPERIVPTPLHLFLGISNRIILDAFAELFGEPAVLEAVQCIKTVHAAGCGGVSDLHELNGPEISKWIKRQSNSSLLTASAASSSPPSDATKATHSILCRWLQQLHHCLLHCGDWAPADIDAWRNTVNDIHQHWQEETAAEAFPKLHMLHHTIDFAERHRFLGRASEAQIESFHATFNALFQKQHRNLASNTTERLRRCLADATLTAMQPIIVQ